MSIRLRIAHGPRGERFPADDDALGRALFGMLVERLQVGVPRPTAFVFWSDRVQIVDLPPLLAAPGDAHRHVASLTAQEGAEAMALLGVLTRRGRGIPPRRFAVGFVEWSDGRWWFAVRPVTDAGRLLDDVGEEVHRAVEGAPRPGGLGGWFSRARFEGLQIRIEPHGEGGMVN